MSRLKCGAPEFIVRIKMWINNPRNTIEHNTPARERERTQEEEEQVEEQAGQTLLSESRWDDGTLKFNPQMMMTIIMGVVVLGVYLHIIVLYPFWRLIKCPSASIRDLLL